MILDKLKDRLEYLDVVEPYMVGDDNSGYFDAVHNEQFFLEELLKSASDKQAQNE